MPIRSRLASIFRTLFHGATLDRDLDDELRGYADERLARHLARGMSPEAAKRAVRDEVGNLETVRHAVRDGRHGRRIETAWRDVCHGARLLHRAPLLASVVILTLGLVIGANATVFSAMYAVLWRELPYPDADRLVLVTGDARGLRSASLAGGELQELAAEHDVFDRLAAIYRINAHVATSDGMENVPSASAIPGALEALGAWPLAHGRLLDAAEDFDAQQYPRAALVSHELWTRHFRGDPGIVGRQIEINNRPITVVGVLRQDFRVLLPASASLPEVPGVVFPRHADGDYRFRASVPSAVGRLAPGVTLAQAQARADAIASRIRRGRPEVYGSEPLRFTVTPLATALTADVRPALRALAIAVSFVLLVGCVNVGNLLLARAWTRLPEMAMRQALGAGRLRLAMQLLTETAVLAVCGGLVGVLLTYAGVAVLDWLQPRHLPRTSEITVNGPVMAFVTVLSLATTLAAGLLPALIATHAASDRSRRTARADVQRAGLRRLQRGLVIAEVALCVAPLVAGGLMLRTFINMTHVPLGFAPDGLQTGKVPIGFRLRDPRERIRLLDRATREVGRLEGVRAVGMGGPLPLESQFIQPYGLPDAGVPLISQATIQSVLPGYLGVTGVRLEDGRDFTMDDLTAERRVVIVDRRIATQLWPEGAVGKRIAIGQGANPRVFEIIGVSSPVRALAVRDATTPHVFAPYDQFGLVMSVVVATDRPAASVGPDIKRTIEALGTQRPVHDLLPMRTYVDRAMGDTRFTMLVVIAFATSALALAGIGLYGTLAYVTAQRRSEFGVRMTLGASRGRVLSDVVREGLLLASTGTIIGAAGAVTAGRLLRDQLYGVSPLDAATLAGVAALVVGVALVATIHPAVRAARTDPAVALRAE